MTPQVLLTSFSGVTWVALADAVAKATLLLAAAALASFVLRRASAASRHLVWTLALLSALVLPALSVALPRWQLPIVTLSSATLTPDALPADAAPVPQAPPLGTSLTADARSTRHTTAQPAPAHTIDPTILSSFTLSWSVMLFALWSAGALVILGRLVAGLLAVQWMRRRTGRVTDAPWLGLARELAANLGITRRLVFHRSGRASMPMAWGLFRPGVLMPEDADTWPDARLRIVLLHELAHVKRRDCLTHMLAQVACALYWFNPLAWVAARHLRTERERACDDLVLAAGTRGPDYADELLEIARVMRSGRFPAVLAGASLAMAHRSQLEGRLMAILDPSVPRSGVTRLRTAAATTIFACALMPLASLQPWTYAADRVAGGPAAIAEDSQVAQSTTPGAVQAPTPVPTPAATPRAVAEAPLPPLTPLESALPTLVHDAVRDALQSGAAEVQATINSSIHANVNANVVSNIHSNIASHGGSPQGGDAQDARRKAADPRMVAALSAALKDVDKAVRQTALHALVQLRDPSIYEPLIQALKDAAADVREQAAFGLGQLRDTRAVEPLVSALRDASPDVREQAAFALGQLRDRSAVGALAAALRDISDDVREQVVFALGQLRDPAAIDGLAAALRDAKPDVREQAAFSLGQIRDSRAVEPLISALKDPDADVREQAAFALGHLRDRAAVEALVIALKDADGDVREQAAFALGQLRDPRAIDGLTAALKDPKADVRQQAAFALGQLIR